jgi:hypothetical protein
VTFLTLDKFYTLVYGWSGIWLVICCLLLVSRHDKNAADWEIIGFRASIAFVCLSVAFRRIYDLNQYIVLPALSVFAWTAMMNTIRVAITIWRERRERNADYFLPHHTVPGFNGMEERIQEEEFTPNR